jgi:arylsulfatase A-like enzyme
MQKFNIILLLIDGARVDRIDQFPIFKKLQNDGTFFNEMITHAPYTLVSMNSIFTGMYGGKNGINAYYQMYGNPKEGCQTLAEYLSENGWYTCGDAMRLSLVSHKGFKKITSQEDIDDPDFVKIHSKILDEIKNEKDANQPFFAYLHYPKIHHSIKENVFDKYDDFSEEYFSNKEQNLKNYDSYLKEASDYLEKIYQKIIDDNLHSNSIIIVMADHGMGVGEKVGERAYGIFTYDYSIKTFAFFIQPKIFPKGKLISEITETIDIMPTVLNTLEIPEKKSCLKTQGENLMTIIEQSNENISVFDKNELDGRFTFSETGGVEGPWPSPKEPNVKCIRNHKWKLIHNLTPDNWELYDLEKDPQENTNLINSNPKIIEHLKSKLSDTENNDKN